MTSPTTDLEKSGSVSDLDPKRWLALIVIGIAQLMVVLDATIVNIALPDAATALHISDANRQWIVTAYALPFGALLLLGGRIGDYLGRKKILMIALGGFALASALGGIAQDFVMLAGARALQGVFAAMLAPSTLSMLTVTFRDPKERAKAFAVFGAIAGGGAAVGLVLGGLLTEYATWRWCLLVNVPISVVAIIGTSIYLHESNTERQGSYDVLGALLGTIGLGMLVWGFNQAASHSWSSPSTWGWLVGAVVLLVLFVVLESRNPHAILPMRILKDRNRAGAYVVGLLVGTGLFAVFLFLTFFLQGVKLWSPVQSGVAFLPFSAGVIIGAGVGSQLVLKVGAKIVVPAGLILGVLGLVVLSRLTLSSSYVGTILPAVLLMSVGMGFIFMSTTNVALHGVDAKDSGVASAMVNTTQQIGGSLGTALLSTFAVSATTAYIAGHIDSAATGAAVQLYQTNPNAFAAAAAVPDSAAQKAMVLINAASTHGYSVAFTWAAGLFALATVASLLLINASKTDAAAVEPGLAMA
ncbi:drug resistance transporter, EmrB/QacA subfamily [Nakamurella panacisegetis]|uniref:Drug resistance transporter, EmrB/QacA subfamily n=1 Tax=Nakamurella panacisegetis TaxID=1090615 RepID=A0A1H0RQJ7_9ACTN|nr:MFS transporter [Nakamurella panacisegetis]SDP31782.1 drug resistance transporter, EmrB/QacA subfamily [Nakamurella panacisegetis]